MAVLATLILLSYTKLLQTVIIALSFTHLEYPDGTTKVVWLLDGNVEYFEGKHLILVVFSSAILIFIFLPFTLFLMFGYHFLGFSDKRGFTWLNKFKPLLDAYYGPYQTQTRYWTGLMLLLRACLYLTFVLNEVKNFNANLLAILTVFSVIIAIPWLHRGGIYKWLYLDLLEASFVLNICLLTAVTYHIKSVGGDQALVTTIFVGIAFAEFIVIVNFHFFQQIYKYPYAKHLVEIVRKKI